MITPFRRIRVFATYFQSILTSLLEKFDTMIEQLRNRLNNIIWTGHFQILCMSNKPSMNPHCVLCYVEVSPVGSLFSCDRMVSYIWDSFFCFQAIFLYTPYGKHDYIPGVLTRLHHLLPCILLNKSYMMLGLIYSEMNYRKTFRSLK